MVMLLRLVGLLLFPLLLADASLLRGGATRTGEIKPLERGYVDFSPGIKEGTLINCARYRIPGISRLRNVHKAFHAVRVNASLEQSALFSTPKVQVSLHRNGTSDLCISGKDAWKLVERGKWVGLKSPFQTMYLDARATGSITDLPLAVFTHEEFCLYRFIFFVIGLVLLTTAPTVSRWVPFYYSSAMTLGVFLVVIILLFQGMKLLPTGRKSSLYIIMYGSLVGLGTVILRHVTSMIAPLLTELGFAEDAFKPTVVFLLTFVIIMGAWLGYWGVRKFILTSEGEVDDGTCQFVKWSLRLVGVMFLLQSSYDPVFGLLALFLGVALSFVNRVPLPRFEEWDWHWPSLGSDTADLYSSQYRKKHCRMWRRKFERSPYGGASSSYHTPVSKTTGKRVFVSPPHCMFTPENDYPSVYHRTPERKRLTKAQYEELGRECTMECMRDLVSSPEFATWLSDNAGRLCVLPDEAREERSVHEIALTASMETDG